MLVHETQCQVTALLDCPTIGGVSRNGFGAIPEAVWMKQPVRPLVLIFSSAGKTNGSGLEAGDQVEKEAISRSYTNRTPTPTRH
jgi:hypothetical protein